MTPSNVRAVWLWAEVAQRAVAANNVARRDWLGICRLRVRAPCARMLTLKRTKGGRMPSPVPWRPFDCVVQPGTCELPFALHRGAGDAEHVSDLIIREPAEVLELHHAPLAAIELLQSLERLVQDDRVHVRLLERILGEAERHAACVPATLGGRAVAGVIDEDAAH